VAVSSINSVTAKDSSSVDDDSSMPEVDITETLDPFSPPPPSDGELEPPDPRTLFPPDPWGPPQDGGGGGGGGYGSGGGGPVAPPSEPSPPPIEAAAPPQVQPPPSKDAKIADAIKKGDLNEAAKLAAQGTAAQGRVTVDPSLAGRDPPVLGITDNHGRIRLSPEAFRSPGLLRSVLAHEAKHVQQIDSGNFHASTDRNRPDHIVNEIESLYAGIQEAKNHPDDLELQAQRAVWQDKVRELVDKLQGTPYHANVMKNPPDFTLAQGDRCPSSVCYLK
jgi:hypothetical protein